MKVFSDFGSIRFLRGRRDALESRLFFALSALILVSFALGGASRADVVSLLLLRPLSAAIFAFAVAFALAAAWRRQWQPVALMIAIVMLTALHLVPLPPVMWQALPGRQVVADVFAATDTPIPWFPLSMAPVATSNALFSLMGPVAALLLALAIRSGYYPMLLRLILAAGLVSALIGLFQILGPTNGPLYFYRITNNGTAVGLFSNRNHHAIFLATLFPLLAAYAATARKKSDRLPVQLVIAVAGGAFLVPLLLVTGSRAGLLLGVVGLLASAWVYRLGGAHDSRHQSRNGRRPLLALLGGSIVLLGLMTVFASRAPAFQRLIELDPAEDLRVRAFPVIWDAVWAYFPFGSGIGSFAEVYRVAEPAALLSNNYLNHAHNDVLELALVGGLPAIALMMAALLLGLVVIWKLATLAAPVANSQGDDRLSLVILARAGISGMIILALGSIADYPLRTPSLSVAFAVFVAFSVAGLQAAKADSVTQS